MRRCDVFICMSGMYLRAPRFAKWRYGARIFLHRASQHILAQDEILSRLPQSRRPTPLTIRRELAGYELADLIVVPSKHVEDSSAAYSGLVCKVFRRPYGVDLDQFPLRKGCSSSDPTVLFVGHWSYRKGADVLTDAIQGMESVRLVHVGSLMDVPFPDDQRFTHHEPVSQWKLMEFYQRAHVFVLASREDGFGYVLSQAVASGLSVVCTDRTGGPDLVQFCGVARLICVVPVEDANSLGRALAEALDDATGKSGVVPITDEERSALSWRAYALWHLGLMSDGGRNVTNQGSLSRRDRSACDLPSL